MDKIYVTMMLIYGIVSGLILLNIGYFAYNDLYSITSLGLFESTLVILIVCVLVGIFVISIFALKDEFAK